MDIIKRNALKDQHFTVNGIGTAVLQITDRQGDVYTISDGKNAADVKIVGVYSTVPNTAIPQTSPLRIFDIHTFARKMGSTEPEFVASAKPLRSLDFEVIDGSNYLDYKIKKPMNPFTIFARDKGLAVHLAGEAWKALPLVEKTKYEVMANAQAEDAEKALNEMHAKHGVKRKREHCLVCDQAVDVNSDARAEPAPCKECNSLICHPCFKRSFKGKVVVKLDCIACAKPMIMSTVNAFMSKRNFYEILVTPGWLAAALAEDAAHMVATNAFLGPAREAIAWLGTNLLETEAAIQLRLDPVIANITKLNDDYKNLQPDFYKAYLETSNETAPDDSDAEDASKKRSDTKMTLDKVYKSQLATFTTELEAIVTEYNLVAERADRIFDRLSIILPEPDEDDGHDEQHISPERQAFFYSCPKEGCKCMITPAVLPTASTKEMIECPGCSAVSCSLCQEIPVGEEEHICNKDLVKTIMALRKTTKPCPDCGAAIIRSSGCSQMFCTACKMCVFDWVTGLKVAAGSALHNPHMFQLSREEQERVRAAVNLSSSAGPAGECEMDPVAEPLESDRWRTLLMRECGSTTYRGRGMHFVGQPANGALIARVAAQAAHFGAQLRDAQRSIRGVQDTERLNRRMRILNILGLQLKKDVREIAIPYTRTKIRLFRFAAIKKDRKVDYENTVLANYAKKISARDSLEYYEKKCNDYRHIMFTALYDKRLEDIPTPHSERFAQENLETVKIANSIAMRTKRSV